MGISVYPNSVVASGSIPFSQLRTRLKETSSGTIALSELYRNGAYVPTSTANNAVPTSGTIAVSKFYGVYNTVYADITGVEQNLNAQTNLFGGDWSGAVKKTINVNGYIISQNENPALYVPGGAGTSIKINLQSGGIFGHRGLANNGSYGPLAALSSYDNGIGVPTYWANVYCGTQDVCDCSDGCYCYTVDYYCDQEFQYGPSNSGVSGVSGGGQGIDGNVVWYWWSQNNRIQWGINATGSSYTNGTSLSFATGPYGSFTVTCYTSTGGAGGGANSGTGAPGNIGRTALQTYSNLQIVGTGGGIRGGGGAGGGGGGGGQEGGGGNNNRGYSCGFFGWQYCQSCDGGVGGGSDAGGPGGNGGQGRGYSYSGGNLSLQGPDGGSGGTNYGSGGGTGGTGGSGGDWGAGGGTGGGGSSGNTGPGGNCRGGGGGAGGGGGGGGGYGGGSINGYNRVVSIDSTAVLSGATSNN